MKTTFNMNVNKFATKHRVIEDNRPVEEFLQQERRKIFVLMYDCGFISNNDSNERKLQVINGWINKKMNLDKNFNSLNIDELLKMQTQLRTVRRIYAERAKKQSILN